MTAGKIKLVHYCSVWLEITQTWLYNQVKYLPPDIENHIVSRSARNLDQFALDHIHALKEEEFGHYLLYKLSSLFGKKDGNVRFFKRHLTQIKPDVIHSHFGNNGWAILDAVRDYGAPHFVTFYGQDVSRLPQEKPVWLKRYANMFNAPNTHFLCEGPFMVNSLIKMGCPADKVRVHHLGIEVDKISYQPRKWDPDQPLKVLIASSFREKKGIPYALEALGKISKDIPVAITIIGDAGKTKDSVVEKRRILEMIDLCNLGPVTRMMGYQPQQVLWEEAYTHHLFLSPSVTASDGDTEGGAPLSIIEMAASGMPIVSSFHCDIPEVIDHGTTGWLAAERDVDDIVKCIRQWMEHPEDWDRMLMAGRQHILENYNAAFQGETLGKYYRQSLTVN